MQYDKLFRFFYHIDFENMIKKKPMDPRHKRTQIPKTPETAVLLHSRDNDPWDPWNLRDPVMPGVTWLLGNKPRDSWDLGDIRNHWDNWDPDIPVIPGNESRGRQEPQGNSSTQQRNPRKESTNYLPNL